jgi:hypothetical protein
MTLAEKMAHKNLMMAYKREHSSEKMKSHLNARFYSNEPEVSRCSKKALANFTSPPARESCAIMAAT